MLTFLELLIRLFGHLLSLLNLLVIPRLEVAHANFDLVLLVETLESIRTFTFRTFKVWLGVDLLYTRAAFLFCVHLTAMLFPLPSRVLLSLTSEYLLLQRQPITSVHVKR